MHLWLTNANRGDERVGQAEQDIFDPAESSINEGAAHADALDPLHNGLIMSSAVVMEMVCTLILRLSHNIRYPPLKLMSSF